jgi:hypothetical protein
VSSDDPPKVNCITYWWTRINREYIFCHELFAGEEVLINVLVEESSAVGTNWMTIVAIVGPWYAADPAYQIANLMVRTTRNRYVLLPGVSD